MLVWNYTQLGRGHAVRVHTPTLCQPQGMCKIQFHEKKLHRGTTCHPLTSKAYFCSHPPLHSWKGGVGKEMVQNSQGPSAQTRGRILEWSNRIEQPVASGSWDQEVKSNSSEDSTQILVKQSTMHSFECISAARTDRRKWIKHTRNTFLSLKQKGKPRNRQGREQY